MGLQNATILAASATLRGSNGRDRNHDLRNGIATWNARRYEEVGDTRTDRSVSAMAMDLEATVCDAALIWESDTQRRITDSKTRGAAEHVDTPPPQGSQCSEKCI